VPGSGALASTTGSTTSAGSGDEPAAPNPQKPHGPAETAESDPRLTGDEQAAADTAREYIAALDTRDGEAVCGLMTTGAIYAVELPVRRPGECRSLSGSIGYRDPRGLPVWAGARVARVRSISVDGLSARVVLTVVTRFADRPQASVEDDVIYLSRASGTWLVAKPSSTLYRAVGIADVPPSVLSPP
jgi:hypothetical protein